MREESPGLCQGISATGRRALPVTGEDGGEHLVQQTRGSALDILDLGSASDLGVDSVSVHSGSGVP